MTLPWSIDHAGAERIGPEGVAAGDLADAIGRTGAALEWLRARHADGGLPLLRLPAETDDLAATQDAARRLTQGATDIVLLGTGGSSLGGQALAHLARPPVPGLPLPPPRPPLPFLAHP